MPTGRLSMATQTQPMSQGGSAASGRDHAPIIVPLLNPIVRRLMGVGVPLGPNALLSVRGRKTGQLRTTPIAVVDIGGRRGGAPTACAGNRGGKRRASCQRGPATLRPHDTAAAADAATPPDR